MTNATKVIKISQKAHRQLKMLAAKREQHVWELVDEAVALLKTLPSNGETFKTWKLKVKR